MPLKDFHIESILNEQNEENEQFLYSIINMNIQNESTEKSIINSLNKFLSTAKNRKQGLEILTVILENCSPTAITENALNWINHCIIIHHNDVFRELKLRTLGAIIEASHHDSDFNKKFITDFISKVLENCLAKSNVNSHECQSALSTLTTIMKYYSSWFGTHKQKIEDFVLVFLDSNNEVLVYRAALSFHFLQQVGGAGQSGINHKTQFTDSFHKLCHTVHKLYDKLFEYHTEMFEREIFEEPVFNFYDDHKENRQVQMRTTSKRIHNIYIFIEIMIKTGYPVAKETNPKKLLDVLTRALSFHKCIQRDKEESLEDCQFSLLLQSLQCATLKLLRLFIIWLQSNILPFAYSISKILVESIQRTQKCQCYRIECTYLTSAYKAMSEWLKVSKSSLHPQFQSRLLECILEDITPLKTQVTLTISDSISSQKSQKAKRKAMVNQIISSGNQSITMYSESTQSKIACQYALTTLKQVLEFTKLNVNNDVLKNLYKSIFETILKLQSGQPQYPFTDYQCQVKIYEVLVAFYHQDTLQIFPPAHTTLNILNRGLNGKNRFVFEVCSKGIQILESFCQPICPSLYCGIAQENIEDNAEAESDVLNEYKEIPDEDIENNENSSYHVKYTESDQSTFDDSRSDKETLNEVVIFEEININETIIEEHVDEMRILVDPVVVAPSEDGNEILEGHFIHTDLDYLEVVEETIKTESVEKNKLDENTTVDAANEELVTNISDEEEGEDDINRKRNNEGESDISEINTINLEPVAKKSKLEDESESLDKVVKDSGNKNEEIAEDPDDLYLEDGSFADQLKDYY
ncbi:hypothetical protein ABEB36_003183 [Hypothenemus hampei]|uniref:Pre-rRNA-processing protein RIX1 N-terminal domain-containing protein n=1 Tax=Hypothenemus hampei TaxID=57062 RepID=A0ABD1F8B8_HYPHA